MHHRSAEQSADSLESFARSALTSLESALDIASPCPRGDACPDCATVRAARARLDAGHVPEAALLVLLAATGGRRDGGIAAADGIATAITGLATTPRGYAAAVKFGLLAGMGAREDAPVVPDGRTHRLGSASNPVVFDAEKVSRELLARMRRVKPAIDAAMPLDPWDDPTELAVRCAEQYLDGGMPEKALLVLVSLLTDPDDEDDAAPEGKAVVAAVLGMPVGAGLMRVAYEIERPERDN